MHICDIDAGALAAAREEVPGVSTTLADVGSEKDIARVFDEAVRRLGGLDILVNNAGPSGPTVPVDELTYQDWRACMSGNLDGAFLSTRAAAPHLKEAGTGAIVNMSSVSGLFGSPLRSPYAAAKWALLGLTKTWAAELGPYGIRGECGLSGRRGRSPTRPGSCRTWPTSGAFPSRRCPTSGRCRLPSGPFIEPDEIANLVLYLCSPLSAGITGAVIPIDGHLETLVG